MRLIKTRSLDYAELHISSNFSFLRGASHPDELVSTAQELGLAAIALTDRNTLSGVVRAHIAAKQVGIPFVVGCRLDLTDGPSLLCYPTDRAAYGRLSRLLTSGKRRSEKGECHLTLEDVYAHAKGQIFILLPPRSWSHDSLTRDARTISDNLGSSCFLSAQHSYRGDDRRHIAELDVIAQKAGTPLVATGNVLYHTPARRPLQDVVTCIREHCTIANAGFHLEANAERHLRAPSDMMRLFTGHEAALARTMEITKSCQFTLKDLRYNYPNEPVPGGKTPQQHLEDLTWAGAARRYPDGVPQNIEATLQKELALISELNFALYFLTVHDIVRWARDQKPPILCQGRGSAANSVVCYCLFITSVDPTEIDLLFERFISRERKEPPDIDVDFEHERREEVMQYIYERYGRERAGIAATVITYRSRSATRDVGKVMGLSEDITSALVGTVWGSSNRAISQKRVREAGLDPDDLTLRRTLALTSQLTGFPRHLSQHVGGFVLTEDPLCEIVPIGNAAMDERTFIEWDKDDINALGILKIDVLALGMLTCIQKCLHLLKAHYGEDRDLASFFPANDTATFKMIQNADTLGVFQIESRAQMSMLPRLKPKDFYDLVIEIAIVRPGPIQGGMVHPYLRRRKKLEKAEIPSPKHGDPDELKNVLGKTLGVPLFQEQAMSLAMKAAKFTSAELNGLRRAMATFRRAGTIHTFEDLMVTRMVARGYEEDFAKRCFSQIQGFAEYGFPESHSASFALLAYVSSWLKCHRPAVFACGLLNSQPMGFYAPAQIVRDAREHGVEVRSVDINMSAWDNTLEPIGDGRQALRLGLRQVDGMNKEQSEKIVAARNEKFTDMEQIHDRSGVPPHVLERLADGDAFRSMGLDRRAALWQVRGLSKSQRLPLFAGSHAQDYGPEQDIELPKMSLPEHVVADYQTLRLSLKAHPMELLRDVFQQAGCATTAISQDLADRKWVSVAGLVLVRQRPGTAKGVMFMTIEDETGVANAVIWPKMFEKYRKIAMGSRLVVIHGRIQSHDGVVHVVANRLEDHSDKLHLLSRTNFDLPLSPADEVKRPIPDHTPRRHPRTVRIIPKSRDFH